ncbi:unnamed protein product [[Candida] boidinii]|nr:unnamed protein product [[Candida] boidinii]
MPIVLIVKKSFRSASLNNGDDDGDDDDDDGNNDDDDDDEENVADGLYDGQAENGKDSAENEEDCPMTLFHMVFVINPPVVEYNYRIDEMFHFIISRLSMILRHEQNKSNYIWEQVSQILEIKRENTDITVSDLYSLLFEKSELARLIRDTYESVSRSEIANLKINGKLRSFQIPIKKEFSFLPPKEMPFLLGSTLSSVSPFLNLGYGNFDSFGDSDTITQFALILLDDPEIIIKDLNAEKNSPGETLIRIIKPTESLAKLSTLSGLPINEVVTFANHLVYWRRAKAIFPISPKNVYIISPIAPLSNLYRDSAEFSVKFPSLPKLPEFLSIISTSTFKPKSLSSIIPSREHKELYLNAVTSLIKLGYLCQLHTFLLLRITKDIRIKVEEDLEKERKRNSNKDHDHGHHRRQVHEDTTGDTTENGYQTTNASGLLGRHNNPGSSRLAAPGTSSSAISGSSSSIINNDPVGSAAMVTSESTLDTNNSMSGHQLNADRSIFEFDREEDVIVLEPASDCKNT